ncbi:MAG: transcription elongation factor GreA [Elusimicrobiales bacterium]
MEDIILTEEGLRKIREELQKLYKERDEINKEIEDAREQGDLTENAGYQYAKEKQGIIFRRITELETLIKNAKVVDKSNISKDEVRIGAKIEVLNIETSQKFFYQIVSIAESNPLEGKISVSSPLGEGLLGAKVGEERIINLPSGNKRLRVISIEY